jgi:chromosome segregation ATPase
VIKHTRTISVLFAALVAVGLVDLSQAQEVKRQEPAARPKAAPPGQKPAGEAVGQEDAAVTQESTEAALRRSITGLSDQISILTSEVKRLREESERSSVVMELLLNEERLARVEEKIDAAMEAKSALDAREQEIQRRLRNIQQEVTMRGGAALRRDEAEAAIRADFNRALEETRNQQGFHQQRIAELQSDAERIRARVAVLRKRLERYEKAEAPPQQ